MADEPKMKARDIRVGDVLPGHYKVLQIVSRTNVMGVGSVVRVLVQYDIDGGTDIRTWYGDDDVPLVRP